MSEFITYTIVVREADDVIADVLQHSAEGICFLASQRGVSPGAVALGAEPTSWDMPLDEICASIYHRSGATGVYDYVRKYAPARPWRACEPCGADTPEYDHACLVCGNEYDNDTEEV